MCDIIALLYLFLELGHILTIYYIYMYIIYISENLKKIGVNMTDCIRSLLINCSHLKELSILSNITFHHLSYLKISFQFIIKSNVRQNEKFF